MIGVTPLITQVLPGITGSKVTACRNNIRGYRNFYVGCFLLIANSNTNVLILCNHCFISRITTLTTMHFLSPLCSCLLVGEFLCLSVSTHATPPFYIHYFIVKCLLVLLGLTNARCYFEHARASKRLSLFFSGCIL